MKRLFLLGCLVLVLVDVMAYDSVLVEGRIWQIDIEYKRESRSSDGELLIDDDLNAEYYKLEGDSVVGNMVYKKVYMTEYYRDAWRFYCLVREDVEAQRIWRYYDEGEELLMDFLVEEGDTLGSYGVCEKIEYVRDKEYNRFKKITFEGGKNVWVEKYGFEHKDYPDRYYSLNSVRDENGSYLIDFNNINKATRRVILTLPEGVDLKNIKANPSSNNPYLIRKIGEGK